jgi:hypothetical protein
VPTSIASSNLPDVRNAALHGLEAQKKTIERHVEQVRSLLGIRADRQKRRRRPPKSATTALTESAAPSRPTRKRRKFSTATRMSEAQRKRYAVTKKEAPPAKAVTKEQKL